MTMRHDDNPGRGQLILGACLGEDVHVAGVLNFLRLAEEQVGYTTEFLGPATPVEKVVAAVKERRPHLVAIGYRLGPEAAGVLLGALARSVRSELAGVAAADGSAIRWVFGGTPPVAEEARTTGLFEAAFSGEEGIDHILAFLRGKAGAVAGTGEAAGEAAREAAREAGREAGSRGGGRWPDALVERIAAKKPYPLIRHHFGLATVDETVQGAAEIARAEVLDVLSLGPDQNAQESFFRPEEMDPRQDGAGGVPLRTPDDLRRIYQAGRLGSHPLVRCYSGTRDLVKMAAMYKATINLAWGAVPLFWYSVLDGRSNRGLEQAISENLAAVAWHADQGIPVEINESHHWSLREAPDEVAVAAAYLAAYNAKKAGVRHYVSQYMLNTPPGTTAPMDLAKMLAKIDLIESLHDGDFTSYRQVRAGLMSFPTDHEAAKGQLGYATWLGMCLKPHIVHVVAACEAHHAARPADVIESCRLARGVIDSCLAGLPDPAADPAVDARRRELGDGAMRLLDGIKHLAPDGCADPWTHPATLAAAVRTGLLDAPHLAGNPHAAGRVRTRMVGGACRAIA